jgi:hypothetical protein
MDDCCLICNDIITNEFTILNCNCKSSLYHKSCIEQWFKISKKCPTCNKKFHEKPTKYKKLISQNSYSINSQNSYSINNQNIFAINYNILRIMSGMSGLRYSS